MATSEKTITCRAAVVWKEKGPFVIETVEVDPPKADEVRVQITSAGLCHTDLTFKNGIDYGFEYPYPTVLGHEGAGIVESVGTKVKSVAPGDLVVIVPERYCGECISCKNSKTSCCRKQPRNHFQSDGTSRIRCKGQTLSQMLTLGVFSEYTVVSELHIAKINPKAPANKISLAGCCILTGYGAVVNCAKVEPGSTCAIWGLGGVGMNVVIGCKERGASKIIGLDINPNKFELAKELGCTHVIDSKTYARNVRQLLTELTDGGVDYCFVCVGDTEIMQEAVKSSHPEWGVTVIIGLCDMKATINIFVQDLLLGRKLVGTYCGSSKAKLEMPRIVEKIMKNEIPLDKLVSRLIPLDDINSSFESFSTGESIRTVIDFSLKK